MDRLNNMIEEAQYRYANVEDVKTERYDEEERRTFEVAFSTEESLVLRNDPELGLHYERLGHAINEVDQEWIASGRAPLLLQHDMDDHIGVVESVRVEGGVARALVRVGTSAKATEIWNDVKAGIRNNVSVGYTFTERQKEEEKYNGRDVYRVTQWKPFEVSIVSVPADTRTGVGRAQTDNEPNIEIKEEIEMSEEKNTPELDVQEITRTASLAEKTRVREIASLGRKYGLDSKAEEFINNDKPLEEFRAYVLEKADAFKREAKPVASDTGIGMTQREVQSYSLARALRAAVEPTNRRAVDAASFELEASRTAADALGRQTEGLIIPLDVLMSKRNLSTVTPAGGGNLVGTDHLGASFIDFLDKNLVAMNAGAQMMTGLRGNVQIPKLAGVPTGVWITPEGTASSNQDSSVAFEQVQLSPKTVGANIGFTRQLLLQSDPNADAVIMNRLGFDLARSIDLAVLYGTGLSGQPSGILARLTAGLAGNITTYDAATGLTYTDVVGMETTVAAADANFGNLAYLTNATVKGQLKVTPRFVQVVDDGATTPTPTGIAAFGPFIYADDGTVNGRPCFESNQVDASDIFYGNWASIMIGMWGGLEILVDPYTGATAGNVRITGLQTVDVALQHLEAFAVKQAV